MSNSVANRRSRQTKLQRRYSELMTETPTRRVQIMNEEFGPYWAMKMLSTKPLPAKLVLSNRYLDWCNENARRKDPK